MNNESILLVLLLMGLGVVIWSTSMRAREAARGAAGRACRRYNVQLLDDTVALERLWPRRDGKGRLRLERTYLFEFYDPETRHRRQGSVVLLGSRVEMLYMEPGELFFP